jgi:hypothetical protein
MRNCWAFLVALAGCGMPAGGGDMGGADLAMGGSADLAPCATARYTEDVSKCMHAATDYEPRVMMSANDQWPKCVSDDNIFHLIGMGLPPAASRVAAFETMSGKLWANQNAPSSAEFLSARDDYSVMEGLASRVARRQDVSYPEVPGMDKFACANAGVPEMYPDRCAGPAKLKPIIDDAFAKGEAGTQPIVQAARIEAALLWFFYLSMRSEVWTCGFDDFTDCDAAAGYYTRVQPRDQPIGLAKYVNRLGPETHNRIYDALLAERCWRDYSGNPPPLPADPMYMMWYVLAQAQLDKATLRGEALILRERIGRIACDVGEMRDADIEFVKIIGGLLDHGAGIIDPTNAPKLRAFTSAPTNDPNAIAAAQANIDAIFGCP